MLPKTALYYYCKPDVPRGLQAAELAHHAERYGLIGKAYSSVNAALEAARENSQAEDLIFVGGSNFVVAEVI
ncbi:MAG: hypothetical protein U5L96_18635 [Owenweeksia sp.]|nr:hypothetical protein [Owenweeksia sp.]